jgi:hypothetical protein
LPDANFRHQVLSPYGRSRSFASPWVPKLELGNQGWWCSLSPRPRGERVGVRGACQGVTISRQSCTKPQFFVPQLQPSEIVFICNISDIYKKLCGTPRHRCGTMRPQIPLFSFPGFSVCPISLIPKLPLGTKIPPPNRKPLEITRFFPVIYFTYIFSLVALHFQILMTKTG